jgi:hypothetical protein
MPFNRVRRPWRCGEMTYLDSAAAHERQMLRPTFRPNQTNLPGKVIPPFEIHRDRGRQSKRDPMQPETLRERESVVFRHSSSGGVKIFPSPAC